MARMDQPSSELLRDLNFRHGDVSVARSRLDVQIERCIEAGCTSVQIAEQLGCEPGTVRKMRVWKERRR
jgi:DNA-binding CsgD family transcriptional regulator